MEKPTEIVSVFTYKVEYKVVYPKLPEMVTATTTMNGFDFSVYSRPLCLGEFTADGWDFGFGGKFFLLGTKDLHEAIVEAERRLLVWAKHHRACYQAVLDNFPKDKEGAPYAIQDSQR